MNWLSIILKTVYKTLNEIKTIYDNIPLGLNAEDRKEYLRRSSKEKIKSLTLLQEKLLESIFPLLKKDGTLVYSTCTICPDENNLLIERFIEKNKTLKLVSQKQILPRLDYPGDGFYSAIISYKS